MDVGTFKVRLAGLPFLTKSDVLAYQQMAARGADKSILLRRAYRDNQIKRGMAIAKKRKEFALILADVKLGRRNKMSLLRLVNDKTDLKRLKSRANRLVEIRKREAKTRPQQALSRFLTGLKINQADKMHSSNVWVKVKVLVSSEKMHSLYNNAWRRRVSRKSVNS